MNNKELKEIRINETDVLLQNNLVRGSILPQRIAELNRNIIFKGNNVVEGPVFGHRIEIQQGELEIQGAVFAQLELYVNSEAQGLVEFKKSVGSSNSIVSRAANCRIIFDSDINAKSVSLHNAFVAGSIYADEISLDNCVVIGGVFATQNIELNNSIVGTFNTPQISISGIINLLLPSAFSIIRTLSTISLISSGSMENALSGPPSLLRSVRCFSTILEPRAMEPTATAVPMGWSDKPVRQPYVLASVGMMFKCTSS